MYDHLGAGGPVRSGLLVVDEVDDAELRRALKPHGASNNLTLQFHVHTMIQDHVSRRL